MSVYCRYAIMKGKKCLGHIEVPNIGENEARAIREFVSYPIGKEYKGREEELKAMFCNAVTKNYY